MPTNQKIEFLDSSNKDFPLKIIQEKYASHPSIKLIKTKNQSHTFRLKEPSIDDIRKSIQNLYPKKHLK